VGRAAGPRLRLAQNGEFVDLPLSCGGGKGGRRFSCCVDSTQEILRQNWLPYSLCVVCLEPHVLGNTEAIGLIVDGNRESSHLGGTFKDQS